MAEHIEEIGSTSLLKYRKKVLFNARKVNDKFTDKGHIAVIDDNKSNCEYVPLCGDCYLKYVKIGSNETKKLAELVDKIK